MAAPNARALEGLGYAPAYGAVLEPASLAEAMREIECVFNVAAAVDYWRVGVDGLYRINVEGTLNVLRAALKAGVRRVVFTSSVAALGSPRWMTPADETHAFNLRPDRYHYGYSKVLAEQLVQQFVRKGLDAGEQRFGSGRVEGDLDPHVRLAEGGKHSLQRLLRADRTGTDDQLRVDGVLLSPARHPFCSLAPTGCERAVAVAERWIVPG